MKTQNCSLPRFLARNILFAAFCLVALPKATTAQSVSNYKTQQPFCFKENKGQLKESPDVKYYGEQGGVYVYCRPDKISFVFAKVEKQDKPISEATSQPIGLQAPGHLKPNSFNSHANDGDHPTKISTSRADLILIGANPAAEILPKDQQEYYENYYISGDVNHGITEVHTYNTITYQDIYPKIDMVLATSGKGLEYSFLVHPGGKVSDIQLDWKGMEKPKTLKNGGISYCNSLGHIDEGAPCSYINGKTISSSLNIKKHSFGFNVPGWDKKTELLIDPTLAWSTYFGGNAFDSGIVVKADGFGNVYIAGDIGEAGIASSGAYQTSILGYYDAFLAKFNSAGNRIWATYYGGSRYQGGYSISTDISGNVFMTGNTYDSTGLATSGAYQTSNAGENDGYLAKFSPSGSLSWSTYFGGSEFDEVGGVSVDTSGNVFITGSTNSNSGIASSGAYQSSYTAINYCSFLAKFTGSGSLSWATYFGDDVTYSMVTCTDVSGNVFISGNTASTKLATSGVHQTSLAGQSDIFLAKFRGSGSLSWCTYYGGSKEDEVQGMSTDAIGNLYIAGYTLSGDGIATSGAYQTKFGNGYYSGYLAKFNGAGSLDWSTYTGESITGVSADAPGAIYVSGWTRDSVGVATSGSYQSIFGGGYYHSDGFLAKFSTLGVKSWATYFGGKSYDEGDGVSADRLGNVFLGGSTTSTGLATSGAFQSSRGTAGGSLFLVRFRELTPKIKIPSLSCINQTIQCFGSELSGDSGIHYLWKFGKNDSNTSQNPIHKFTVKGNNTVYLTITDSAGLHATDSAVIFIDGSCQGTPIIKMPSISCINDSVHCFGSDLTGGSNLKYLWKFSYYDSSTKQNPVYKFRVKGKNTVYLTLTDTFGYKTMDSATIFIDSSCVWPGDANFDKKANIFDLLAIGLAYKDTGSKRADTTTTWYAHPAYDWAKSFSSKVNHKHADCNGDGKVDSLDLKALVLNYGKTHTKTAGSGSGNASDPHLYLSVNKDSATVKDTVTITMNLGTSSLPVKDIYGVCFTLSYDPTSINTSKGLMPDLSKCWMGTLGKDLIFLVHNDTANGLLDIGISRNDQKSVSGYGSLGTLSIITPDNVAGKSEMTKEILFGVENEKAIDNNENNVPLYLLGDSVLLYQFSGIQPLVDNGTGISIYPNPASTILYVNAGAVDIYGIRICNLLGEVVENEHITKAFHTDIDVSTLKPGIYYMDITTRNGTARAKFIRN